MVRVQASPGSLNRKFVVGSVVAGGTFGCALALRPVLGTLGVAVVALVYAVAQRPNTIFLMGLIATFVVKPSVVPAGIPLGGVNIYWFEPILLVGAIYSLVVFRSSARANSHASVLALLLLLGLVQGAAQYPVLQVASDMRGVVAGVLSFIIAARLKETKVPGRAVRVVLWLLWWAAGLTVISSITGLPIEARSENASLYLLSAATTVAEATRILSPASFLAVAVLSGTVVHVLAGGSSVRRALPFILPALIIVVLSFSRNNVLGFAASLAMGATVIGKPIYSVGRATKLATALALTAATCMVLFAFWGG